MLRLLKAFAASFVALLGATTAARADPVSAFILGFLLLDLTATNIAITTFILTSIVLTGVQYVVKALTPKPKTDILSQPGGTSGKLQTGGIVPRSFIVGQAMTAGSLAYANTYGAEAAIAAAAALGKTTAAVGNTPNDSFVQVIALSDIPVTGLAGLFVNGVEVTWNPGATPTFEGIAIPEFNKNGKDYLFVRFYDGTQVAADAQLVQLFGSDPDRPYESTRIGTGVAYAVVTALVNQDLFPSFPQFKFVLDGVKLYDRRYDTSVGGSGSQRWADSSTWAFTSNPIVIKENILRGISFAGQWVYGAQTVSAAQLPSASWAAAANECDVAIDLVGGGTEPQFVAGGEIRFDVQPADTLDELNKADNGKLAEIGGVYKVRVGAAGAAVFSFTDADILSTEQQTFDPFPSLGQTVNAITAKYISPADGWTPKDAPPLYDATLEVADGGRRQAADINYSFVSSGTQVQRLMRGARNEHRAMRQHALPMPPDAFVLEPLDIVSWTSTRNGYIAKLFDIFSAEDLPNLNMGIAVREVDPNAYDWTPATDEQPISEGSIVIVRPPAQAVVDWNAIAWTIVSDTDGRELPAIKLSWDFGSVDISGVRFEVRLASTSEAILTGETDRYSVGALIISANLIGNTAYQVRGQYIPTSVRDVAWSSWINVTTPDVRLSVAALDNIIQAKIEQATTRVSEYLKQLNDDLGLLSLSVSDHLSLIHKRIGQSLIAAGAQYQDNKATIDQVATVAADANEAVAQLETDVATQFSDASSSIEQILLSISNINYSFAAVSSQVTAVFSEASARITSVSLVATSNTGALASLSSSVDAHFVTTDAGVATNAAAAASNAGAIASLSSSVDAHFATTDANVSTNAAAAASNAGAIASLSNTLTVTYNGIAQRLTETLALAVDNQNSIGYYALDLTVKYNNVSASGLFRTVVSAGTGGAVSDIDLEASAEDSGIFARAALKIRAFVAGQDHFSQLIALADQFLVGILDVTGGDPIAPFGVHNVNGIPQMSLASDMYADNSIPVRALSSDALAKITTASASDQTRTGGAWHNSGSGQPVIVLNGTVSNGSAIEIKFRTVITQTAADDGSATGWFKIKVNGSVIKTINIAAPKDGGIAYYVNYPFEQSTLVSGLSGGALTVEVDFELDPTSIWSNLTLTAPELEVREFIGASIVDGSAAVTLNATYESTQTANGPLTSKTWSAVGIGAADAFRNVVVAIGWYCPYQVYPTVTIGGIAATLIDGWQLTGVWCYLYTARVPTGTTADISYTLPAGSPSIYSLEANVWRVIAFNNLPVQHASDRGWYGATSNTGSWNFINGQVMTVGLFGDSYVTGFTCTSSGSDAPTENVDTTQGDSYMNGRYAAYTTAITNTESAKVMHATGATGAVGSWVGVFATWQ